MDFKNTSGGGVTLLSNAFANRYIKNTSAGTATIFGAGRSLTVAALDAQQVTFDRVIFVWDRSTTGGFNLFNTIKFQSYTTSNVQFEIKHPGNAGTITMGNLTFHSILDAGAGHTGFYLRATDSVVNGTSLNISFSWGGETCVRTSPLSRPSAAATPLAV